MSVEWTKISEGDAVTDQKLNNTFASDLASAGVNALAADDIARGALRFENLGGSVGQTEVAGLTPSSGTLTINPTGTTIAVTATHPTFAAIDGTNLDITFTAMDLGMAETERVAAILVLCDLEVQRATYSAGSAPENCAAARIEWYDGSSWNAIGRSERSIPCYHYGTNNQETYRTISIRTLITDTDIGASQISKIRPAACFNPGSGTVSSGQSVTFRRCRITVLFLHSQDPA